jgi:hypothetical protein
MMADSVIAHQPYIYAFSFKDEGQKVAKIPGGTVLKLLGEAEGYYKLAPLPAGSYEAYPVASSVWWVRASMADKYTGPVSPPVSGNVSDIEAAAHIVAIIRWLKEL